MKPTHTATGISVSKIASGFALDVVGKGGEHLLIALTDAQLRGLALLIAATLPPPQDQSAGH